MKNFLVIVFTKSVEALLDVFGAEGRDLMGIWAFDPKIEKWRSKWYEWIVLKIFVSLEKVTLKFCFCLKNRLFSRVHFFSLINVWSKTKKKLHFLIQNWPDQGYFESNFHFILNIYANYWPL